MFQPTSRFFAVSALLGLASITASAALGQVYQRADTIPIQPNRAHACPHPVCCNPDFNGDGSLGTDADIADFFACLGGNCCPTCGTADFNCDGNVGTDADIASFFRVLAGGPC